MHRNRQGFTLVEIAVAAALLGLVLVPVLGLATSNTRKMAVSHHHMRAQMCARDALAELAHKPYGELAVMVGGAAPELAVPEDFPGTLSVAVKDAGAGAVPQSSTPRMLEVAVTVKWSPYGKKSARGASSLTLSRLMSVPELGLVRPLAING